MPGAAEASLTPTNLLIYPYFVNLVEHAGKSFIDNRLEIEVDIGEIHGGRVIGKIKEILGSYANQEQIYQD
jgi:hypothetical protein